MWLTGEDPSIYIAQIVILLLIKKLWQTFDDDSYISADQSALKGKGSKLVSHIIINIIRQYVYTKYSTICYMQIQCMLINRSALHACDHRVVENHHVDIIVYVLPCTCI